MNRLAIEDLKEQIAELCFKQWQMWLRFSIPQITEMNKELKMKWTKLVATPYSCLSESEKEPPRLEAETHIHLLKDLGILEESQQA